MFCVRRKIYRVRIVYVLYGQVPGATKVNRIGRHPRSRRIQQHTNMEIEHSARRGQEGTVAEDET